jgi:hypothetical protein
MQSTQWFRAVVLAVFDSVEQRKIVLYFGSAKDHFGRNAYTKNERIE